MMVVEIEMALDKIILMLVVMVVVVVVTRPMMIAVKTTDF
jgi:hypothetical protein